MAVLEQSGVDISQSKCMYYTLGYFSSR
jgi:hypothetical protein